MNSYWSTTPVGAGVNWLGSSHVVAVVSVAGIDDGVGLLASRPHPAAVALITTIMIAPAVTARTTRLRHSEPGG